MPAVLNNLQAPSEGVVSIVSFGAFVGLSAM